jgi:membrane-associated phospholipid phosphatase
MNIVDNYQNKLRSSDKITILYNLLISILILFNFTRITHAFLLLLFNLAVIIFLLRLPFLKPHPILDWLRVWNPVILILACFSELHYLVRPIHAHDYDQFLIAVDHHIFGVHPTVWLEKFSIPWLTEYLQIIYSSFYFLPIILAWLLYRRNRFEEFDIFALVVTYGFFLSYIGYFITPAIGPRFTMDYLQTQPLTGLFFTGFIRQTLDTLENTQRDAFPSGHTMLTILTMFYAAKYHKKYFYVLLLIGPSMILATVYLRYHYVIDVIAGALYAVIVLATLPVFYRMLGRQRWDLNSLAASAAAILKFKTTSGIDSDKGK